MPIATSAAHFEAGLNISNTGLDVLLVNETVTQLEDVVTDFTEIGKILPPVADTAAEEEGTEGKTVAVSTCSFIAWSPFYQVRLKWSPL